MKVGDLVSWHYEPYPIGLVVEVLPNSVYDEFGQLTMPGALVMFPSGDMPSFMLAKNGMHHLSLKSLRAIPE